MKIKFHKYIVVDLIVFIFLFLYIFNPGFRFINSFTLVIIISLFLLLLTVKGYLKFIFSQDILKWSLLVLVCLIYSLFIELIFSPQLSNNFRSRFSFQIFELYCHTIIIVFPFILYLRKKNYDILYLIRIFIRIAFVQSLFTVLFILFPSIKVFFFEKIINLDYLFPGKNELSERLLFLRLNGIGSELTFSFSVFQGFALLLIFSLYRYYKINYLLYTPFILLSIIFNARIGLVIPIIACIWFFIKRINILFKLKNILLISVLFSILCFAFSLIFNKYPELYELFDLVFFAGWSDGNIIPHQNVLLDDHFFFPSDLVNILFGEGVYVFDNEYEYRHSDIGYVNLIMYGGVIFQILMFAVYFQPINCIKCGSNFIKTILSILFISILLVQFKGNYFVISGITKAILIIGFFLRTSFINKIN